METTRKNEQATKDQLSSSAQRLDSADDQTRVMGHMEGIKRGSAEGAKRNKKEKKEEGGRGRRRERGGEVWPHLAP